MTHILGHEIEILYISIILIPANKPQIQKLVYEVTLV
jgi:hypothetical protein